MENKFKVLNEDVRFYQSAEEDYICLTDIAKYKDPIRSDYIIQNWLKNRNTIEFLGIWEQIHNQDFNSIEFDGIRKQAGLNTFILTPKQWNEKTHARGIISKAGRYGGTYAHKDIAFEFATWISPEFKLYLIKEFQRLKIEENQRVMLGWDAKRALTKINYKIHTDAIKENIVLPQQLSQKDANNTYASEADVLNVALFGMTAQDWKIKNKNKEGNM
ncbi:TPA: KilA-N domain-containing protein, partial [Candidatus Woesearchaeota archaeon]|nr:KilA-N domain-containing protein [Candidatus Woesearchaeota archaeon]